MSDGRFSKKIGENRNEKDLSHRLTAFLAALERDGLAAEIQKSIILRFRINNKKISAGYINDRGEVKLGDPYKYADDLGKRQAGIDYQNEVASLIGGRRNLVNRAPKPPNVKGPDGRDPDLGALLEEADGWRAAIVKFAQALGGS